MRPGFEVLVHAMQADLEGVADEWPGAWTGQVPQTAKAPVVGRRAGPGGKGGIEFHAATLASRPASVIDTGCQRVDRRPHAVARLHYHRGVSPDVVPVGFAASYARLVADHVRARDLDATAVLAALGLGEIDTETSPRWVPARDLARALALATECCGDPNTALQIAQQVRPANMGALGYTLISCEAFEHGLALFERLQSLICTQLRAVHRHQGDRIVSQLETLGEVPPDTNFWVFAMVSRMAFARWVSGRPLVLDEVCLPCPSPADAGPLLAYYGCPVRFDASVASERAPAAWLNLPNPHADPHLHRLMSAVTDQQWSQLAQDGSRLAAVLRQQIAARLQGGQLPLLEDVAPEVEADLGLSARQLQRRLAEQSLSFKDLVEQVRRQQVLHELRHTTLALADIAQRAAYAEPSSMHRAVRRWTGLTPLAVRQGRINP
jgi:AraC-like DNA-binding protein